jgi:hypothetical protein
MNKSRTRLAPYLITMLLLTPGGLLAATRTTPVEVFNVPIVKFDPTGNTVKAEQIGTWTVGLSTSANTVKIDTSLNTVKAMQSGTYDVSILGTPTVKFDTTANVVKAEQSGTWNVTIQGTPTVSTQPAYSKVSLFPGENPALAPGARRDSNAIDCRGFKQMHVVLNWYCDSGAPRIGVSYCGATGSTYYDLGYYLGSHNKIITDADFTYATINVGQSTRTALTFPVVSDYMKVWVHNSSVGSATLWGGYCFAYLVN